MTWYNIVFLNHHLSVSQPYIRTTLYIIVKPHSSPFFWVTSLQDGAPVRYLYWFRVAISYKVVPQFGIAKLVQITPITMVYGRYIYTYYGL